jgi:hypothetical protein
LTEILWAFGLILVVGAIAAAIDRWPRFGKAMVLVLVVYFAVAICVWIYRGDLFASSGVEVSDQELDGWAR